MNILILGEFSGFSKYLINGLQKVSNHEIVIFADKDGFKSIKQDVKWFNYPTPQNIKIFGKTIRKTYFLNGFSIYKKFKNDIVQFKDYFDIVFIVDPSFVRLKFELYLPQFSYRDIHFVLKKDGKIFMSSCGGGYCVFQYMKNFLPQKFHYIKNKYSMTMTLLSHYEMKKNIKYIIPVSYRYSESYRLFGPSFSVLKTIPLPYDIVAHPKTQNEISDKIIIYNGVLRDEKGAKFINEALKIIKSIYNDKVEIISDRLPFDQFILKLSTVNIYLDQCGDAYGMAAIIAMASSCVTFTGSCEGLAKELGVQDIPVVAIKEDVNDIVSKLRWWIEHPQQFKAMGYKARHFVEDIHSCDIVAKEYLKIFNESYV